MMGELQIDASLLSLHEDLLQFVKKSTKHFDESHNDEHMLQVVKNSFNILNFDATIQSKCENHPEIARLVLISAWLHDVRDHKYPESISEEEFTAYLNRIAQTEEEATHIQQVIDNISFSKENKGLRKQLEEPYQTVLEIVGDADRLEAIGAIGIKRCEIFTREHGGEVPKDVIVHCHEKLLRILPEGFIKTKRGKELAAPLHKEIVDYVQQHSI